MINCFLSPPITLRMPISFDRFSERATVRFTKLMQAISNMNNAIPESMYEYIGLLALTNPFCGGNSVFMCILVKDCRK